MRVSHISKRQMWSNHKFRRGLGFVLCLPINGRPSASGRRWARTAVDRLLRDTELDGSVRSSLPLVVDHPFSCEPGGSRASGIRHGFTHSFELLRDPRLAAVATPFGELRFQGGVGLGGLTFHPCPPSLLVDVGEG